MPEIPRSESEPQRLSDRRRKISHGILATVAAGSLAYSVSRYENPVHNYLTGERPCSPAPVRDIDIARRDMATPELPFISMLALQNPPYPVEQVLQTTDTRVYDFLNEQASESALHLANYPEYLNELSRSKNIDDALAALNDLTANYGFSVSIPYKNDGGYNDVRAHAVTKDSVRLDWFKGQAKDFMFELGILPIELVRYSKLKEVRLVELPPNIGGVDTPDRNIIYLPIGMFEVAMLHELGNQLDGQMCSADGMTHDSAFTALNRKNFHYKEDLAMPDPNVLNSEAYNVSEDKAVFYSYMLNGLDPELYSESSTIRAKAAYLLGRLEQHVPGTANYFTRISFKHGPSPHGG